MWTVAKESNFQKHGVVMKGELGGINTSWGPKCWNPTMYLGLQYGKKEGIKQYKPG